MVGSHALIVGPSRRSSPSPCSGAAPPEPRTVRRRRDRAAAAPPGLVALLTVFMAAVPSVCSPAVGRLRSGTAALVRRVGYVPAALPARGSLERPVAGLHPARRERRMGRHLVSRERPCRRRRHHCRGMARRHAATPRGRLAGPIAPADPGAVASPSPERRVPPRRRRRCRSPGASPPIPPPPVLAAPGRHAGAWVEHAVASDELGRRPGLLQRLDPRVKLSACWLASGRGLSTRLLVLAALLALLWSSLRLRGWPRALRRRRLAVHTLFTAVCHAARDAGDVSSGTVLTRSSNGSPSGRCRPRSRSRRLGCLRSFVLWRELPRSCRSASCSTLTTPWATCSRRCGRRRAPRLRLRAGGRLSLRLHARQGRPGHGPGAHQPAVGRAAPGEDRRFLGAAVATAFGKSQATSEQVYLAMISRGYSGKCAR